MARRAGSQESVDAVPVDLRWDLDVGVAVKEIQDMSSCSSTNRRKCVEKDWCSSDLLSSNLLPLCLKRLRIHIASDTLDRERTPPAASPEAVAEMLAWGAVESEWYVFKKISINAF